MRHAINTFFLTILRTGFVATLRQLSVSLSLLVVPAASYAHTWPVAEQDSLALVAFYNATDGSNWLSNQDGFSTDILKDDIDEYYQSNLDAPMGKWLEGPIKNWFGVKLETQPLGNTGDSICRVVRLWPVVGRRELGQNKLSGYVPRELGFLTALKWFRINGNDGLEWSELPGEVFHSTLKLIDVEKCQLGGVVSDDFRRCDKIEYINLRYNYFNYMPTLDFIDPDIWLAGNANIIWVYSSRMAYSQLEPSIDFFYTLSPTPKKIKIEARDMANVGYEQEIVVTPGEPVTLTCNLAGTQGKVTWYKKGFNTYQKGTEYTITSVGDADTGKYAALIENDYVKEYDQNTNYGNVFTQPIYIRYAPKAPVLEKASSSYSGNQVVLQFNKPMALPGNNAPDAISISDGNKSYTVVLVEVSGRNAERLTLTLNNSLTPGAALQLAYNGTQITDANGGTLSALSNVSITNLTRPFPKIVNASTRADGMGIVLEFDTYMDAESLNAGDFSLPNQSGVSFSGVSLLPGELNAHISKRVQLSATSPLSDTDEILLTYQRGSATALYGGAMQDTASVAVINNIIAVRTDVTLHFFDGSGRFQHLFVAGDISVKPIELEHLGDNNWLAALSLVEGSYHWSVVERQTKVTYDTVSSTDPATGITNIQITPDTLLTDSVLVADLHLQLTGTNVSGDTSAGINNLRLRLFVDMSPYLDEFPADTAAPHLMGINNDWVEGIEMQPYAKPIYWHTLNAYSAGNQIQFNFRRGDIWENNVLTPRYYTFQQGSDSLMLAFGDVYRQTKQQDINIHDEIVLFPNPCNGEFNFRSQASIAEIYMYNMQGNVVRAWEYNNATLDISDMPKGIYVLAVRFVDRNLETKIFQIINSH